MSVSSRFITLAFALGAIIATSRAAHAQTTAAQEPAGEAQRTTSATTPSTPNAASSNGVTQQAAASDAAAAARIQALEDRIATLEKAEAKARATAAAAPTVTATRDGLNVRSADNAFTFRLRGYVQSDARFFGAAGPVAPGSSTFLLRRVRPIFEATAYKYFGLRLMPDFGNGQTVLYDAYVEAKPTAALNLRVGKFKPPIGLERLQSATDVRFVERGLPTSLVPNRDVGVQLFGDLVGSRVQYQLGAFDGAPDAAISDGDVSTGKDVVGRVFLRPFATIALGARPRPRRGGEQRHGAGDAHRDRAAELQDDGAAVAVPLPRRRHRGEHGDRAGTAHARLAAGLPVRGPGGRARRVRAVDAAREARDVDGCADDAGVAGLGGLGADRRARVVHGDRAESSAGWRKHGRIRRAGARGALRRADDGSRRVPDATPIRRRSRDRHARRGSGSTGG